jgi:glycosyltransferase involved in cell wall biosynthesis
MPGAFLAYVRLLGASRFDVVHFHAAAMRRFARFGFPLLVLARLFGARCVLTVHTGNLAADRRGVGERLMLRGLLALCHRVVAVSGEQRTFLVGALGLDPARLSVIPAFLPPPIAPTSRLAAQLAQWRHAGLRVLCSSGGGRPLYGFHILLDALRRISAALPCGLVLAVGDQHGEAYVQSLIVSAGAVPLIVARDLPPEELAWVLRYSDLYLRCTDRDGDSMAVREALSLGTPVVASDCAARPPGVETFGTNDAADLARAILAVSRTASPRMFAPMPDYAEQLRGVYGLERRDLASAAG